MASSNLSEKSHHSNFNHFESGCGLERGPADRPEALHRAGHRRLGALQVQKSKLRIRSELDQILIEIDRIWAYIDRIRAEIDRIRAE